jgi:hypothetical protein
MDHETGVDFIIIITMITLKIILKTYTQQVVVRHNQYKRLYQWRRTER